MIVTELDALIERVRARSARAGQRRVVIGIAGSPGAGKTTLATRLAETLGADAVHLPMDGFHLANATLAALGRSDRKGAIDTFDGWGFLAMLRRLHAEQDHVVYAPSFHRQFGEPIAGEIAIEPRHRIVITEGNYLLVNNVPWSLVRDELDETWFCQTPGDERQRRLIDRHTRHGRSLEAATAWARDVDGANAVLIDATRHRADLVVSGEVIIGLTGQ